MLAAITDVDAYVRTREAWHTLAERVLAPARHAADGHIGLRPAPGGIETPPFGPEDRQLRARVGNLDDLRDGAVAGRSAPLTTLGAAAAFAGVDLDYDTGVYTATTTNDPGASVAGDGRSATALAAWFAFGADVLGNWVAQEPDGAPSAIQLWPEHFDLATDLGPDDTRRANYGASPGDDAHPLPYLYVGPSTPTDDPFWNAGSYARLGYPELRAAEDPVAAALGFFAAGHAVATGTKS